MYRLLCVEALLVNLFEKCLFAEQEQNILVSIFYCSFMEKEAGDCVILNAAVIL